MTNKIFTFLSALIVVFCLLGRVSSQDIPVRCPPVGDPEECKLPECRCSSEEIPGTLSPANTPQIVYLTFDNAITVSNTGLYRELLDGRKNPNNASISATFFISHEYNNYSLTHELWREGHEIELNSITRYSSTNYWKELNESMWTAEIVDQREQMAFLANIPIDDIKGMRAPFLQTGGNIMYNATYKGNFSWECSRPTWVYRRPGLWPYTNDFESTQDCQITPCPNLQFKGFWTVPMIDFIGADTFPCTMVDSCQPSPATAQETFTLLKRNFDDQYIDGNRAPVGVFTTAAWLQGSEPEFEERKLGYIAFLDYLSELPDVYIVGISKALEWVKNPMSSEDTLNFFEPWKPEPVKPNGCVAPFNCRYIPPSVPAERYMSSCVPCPREYPWIHNPLGVGE